MKGNVMSVSGPQKQEPVKLVVRVAVPRSVKSRYILLPWPNVVAAAEAKKDGLRMLNVTDGKVGRPTATNGERLAGWEDWDDLAILRESGHGWPNGTTLLFQQNW